MPPLIPSRADHVGSFLRPRYLLEARDQFARGQIDAAALRAVEDRAIAEVIRMQEEVGLEAITDGEFRRTYFHIDFLKQLDGVQSDDPRIVIKADGSEELAPPVMRVIGKVRHAREIHAGAAQPGRLGQLIGSDFRRRIPWVREGLGARRNVARTQ